MAKKKLIALINALKLLNNEIEKQVPIVNREYGYNIRIGTRNSSVCYDPFDYIGTSLTYIQVVFSYNQKELYLELDNLNSVFFRKAFLKTSKDVLENVMLVNDLLYDGKDWFYYPPIDIQRDVALGVNSISTPKLLDDNIIREILREAFSDDV